MLSNIDKNKSPFKVPENYFENFNADIMNKLPEKESPKAKIVPLWKKVAPWAAVAAIFVGVLFFTGVFNQDADIQPLAQSEEPESVITNGIASSFEEDYYLFLEDEISKSQYREAMYNN